MKEFNSIDNEYTNYEEVESNSWKQKKRWLWSLIKSYGKRLKANIENKTIRNEAKAVDKQSDSIERDLEKSFIEEINEIAKTSITLNQEDINNLKSEERFQSLDPSKQNEIIEMLKRRFEKNKADDLKSKHEIRSQEETEKRKDENDRRLEEKMRQIREKMEERIKKAEETYRKAHQNIVNWEYEDASFRAEQVLEEIKYQKEFISKLKSFLNSSLFRLKKPKQIFKRQKDIMTTLLLPNGRDMVLIELEKRSKDIKWIAKAKMTKQTKEIKKDLSHPRNMEQEFIWERKPIRHDRTIVWFQSKDEKETLTTRRVLYRWAKKVYIVQQRKWQMLYWAISEDGKPLCPKTKDWNDLRPMFFTKNYRIEKNKLIYETTENSWEYEEIDLE